MSEIAAQPAVMKMTLEITRAATGKTEVVEVVCTPIDQQKEQDHVSDAPDRL